MKYALSATVKYRTDTEEEAKALIEEAKQNPAGTLTKYGCQSKCQKQKGEIIQEWQEVTLTTEFNDAKEPCSDVDISFNFLGGNF